MHTSRSLILASLPLGVLVALSGQAFSSIVMVAIGNCTGLVSYATIQGAVNAVPAGSTIRTEFPLVQT